LDAYAFVLRAIFDMAPKRSKSSIKIIFGDGIMPNELLQMVGIADTCRICLDTYHLLNVDWPRFFGPAYYRTMRPMFAALVYSKTEDEYKENYSALRVKLLGNRSHIEYLSNEIHAKREMFVRHWVSAIEGMLHNYHCLLR
jgi:hypothetical protein